jgi:peptidoglycan-N-acetylglucosamine deacetylase
MMTKMSWTKTLILQSLLSIFTPITHYAIDIAITLDDFPMAEGPILTLEKRTDAYIESFKKHNVKAAFFCIGSHLKTKHHFMQLTRLDSAGHFLANHTISHEHGSEKSKEEFKQDLLEMDQILSPYVNFRKWYRFPYLWRIN